jgi:hypothetical protein
VALNTTIPPLNLHVTSSGFKKKFIICLLSHSEQDPIHSETCLNQLLNKTESLYSILNKVPIKSFLIQSAYTEHLSIPKTKAGPKEDKNKQINY